MNVRKAVKLNSKAEVLKNSLVGHLTWYGIDVRDSLHYVENGIVTIGFEVDECKADSAMEIIGKCGHADIVSREDGRARIYLRY